MAETHPDGGDRAPATLLDALLERACSVADRCAFRYVEETGVESSLTYGELDGRARGVAARLQQLIEPGDRVLLVFPPGMEFISAFLGCLYAGAVAVPATYPKVNRPSSRLSAIARDSRARAVLTTSLTLTSLDRDRLPDQLRRMEWVAADAWLGGSGDAWRPPPAAPDALALIQYTSGSTSEPKGVMVTQANLVRNLEMIHQGFGIERLGDGASAGVAVSWLPAYHDMGLIGGILASIYTGGCSILMSPSSFLQRPQRWLQAISRFHATVSGGPNFAYELCLRKIPPKVRDTLDLSSWQVAFCGAEPIRPETLRRFAEYFAPCGFREESFYPCYGLAEATLLAAGGRGPGRPVVVRLARDRLLEHQVVEADGLEPEAVQEFVGCGYSLLDQQLEIVDPETRRRCPPGRVGEIWIRGGNVAQGYWNDEPLSHRTFAARVADDGDVRYLRTGDLGFVRDEQLFVTGRLKDLIIIRGRNYYPQDIELTVERSDGALALSGGAVFSVERDGEEKLVVVHEVERSRRGDDLCRVIHNIRREVAREHELETHAVVLIAQPRLPRTTSGKVQRRLCCEEYRRGRLQPLAEWLRPRDASLQLDAAGTDGSHARANGRPVRESGESRALSRSELDELEQRIEGRLLGWLRERSGQPNGRIHREIPFSDCGIDSLAAVELSRELEDWLHVRLPPVVAWNYPTPAALAGHLAQLAGGESSPPEHRATPSPQEVEDGLDDLLTEIEAMSESDAHGQLDSRQDQP